MSSPMSSTAATCCLKRSLSTSSEETAASTTSTISSLDLTSKGFQVPRRDSCDVAHARRLARSLSSATSSSAVSSFSATTSSTDDYLHDLTAEDLPFRDSLEFARKGIAEQRERKRMARVAAWSADLPANGGLADGFAVVGRTLSTASTCSDISGRPYLPLPPRDSLDLPLERLAREIVAGRRTHARQLKQRICARVRALATGFYAELTRPIVFGRYMPDEDISVNGRPIEILRNTGHKMTSPDYDVWDPIMTRREYFRHAATADGFSDLDAWCQHAGVRL